MLSQVTEWFLALVAMASDGMVAPWAIALTLAALTLLLEDAAIAAGILLTGEGVIGLPLALAAVAGGIAGGDLLLYALGAAARRLPLVHRHLAANRYATQARRLLDANLVAAVLIARVVPGLRLAIYTVSGLFRVHFATFAALVAIAVAVWTGLLFWLGSTAGSLLMRHWGVPTWAAAVALSLLLTLLPIVLRRLAGSIGVSRG